MEVDETFGLGVDRVIVILEKAITLIENHIDGDMFTGLCRVFFILKQEDFITPVEEYQMKVLLATNKPSAKQFVEFTLMDSWTENLKPPIYFAAFWWLPGDEDSSTISVRHDYLSALLKKFQQLNVPQYDKR